MFFVCLFPKICLHKLSYILHVQNAPNEVFHFIVHIFILNSIYYYPSFLIFKSL